MKKLLVLSSLVAALVLRPATAMPVPAGTIAPDLSYAELSGGRLVERSFSEHEGKILLIMYMTPW